MKYGSMEHVALIESGYNMTKAEAEKIIAERDKDPTLWPYEIYAKAKAMLETIKAKPVVISDRPGWKRSRKG